MRQTLKNLTAIAAVMTLVSACGFVEDVVGERGSGNVVTETRDVAGFSEIVLEGSGEVKVEFTGSESLAIEAEDNLMPLLTSRVVNGRLVLGAEGSISPTVTIIYKITAVSLDGVSIDGSGNVTVPAVEADTFDASIQGSGRIVVSGATFGLFRADISGSGEIQGSGKSDTIDVTISGSGRYSGDELEASSGSVTVSGSGQAIVFVTDALDATISGSGSILYLGDPVVTSDVSGSGVIRRR